VSVATIADPRRISVASIAATVVLTYLLLNAPARAAALLNPAVPVTTILTVQPIVVCQGSGTVSSTPGTGCAPSSGLGAYETYTNAIYDQAGIGVSFAPPEYLDNSAYLNPQVGTTSAALFDTAHNLVDLPGNGQSTHPDTLNMYLVDNLISTTNGKPNGAGIYGYGLIGGNGAIIATAPNSLGRQAALDTMAHELGHNLGLTHVDQAPYAGTAVDTTFNLMNGSSRTVPFETCQVTPYTCAPPLGDTVAPVATTAKSTSGTDALTMASTVGVLPGMVAAGSGIPANDIVVSVVGKTVTLAAPVSGTASGTKIAFASPPETDRLIGLKSPALAAIDNQIGTLQAPPIFTELPAVSDDQKVFNTNPAIPPVINTAANTVSFTGSTPTGLTSAQFRFHAPLTDELGAGYSASAGILLTSTYQSLGPDSQVIVNSSSPLTYPQTFQIGFQWTGNPVGTTADYSAEYVFANGVTSRSGFDSTGGPNDDQVALSQDGAVFTFDPNTPGLPTGPSYLPTGLSDISPITGQLVTEDTDSEWSLPYVVDGTPLPFAALDAGIPAPEPTSLLLLSAAIGGLMALRRRRMPPDRHC
jgi:hypothetical protein